MGKSTINGHFNSYVKLPEGNLPRNQPIAAAWPASSESCCKASVSSRAEAARPALWHSYGLDMWVSIGVSPDGWFISWKTLLISRGFRGTPILGHHHMYIYIYIYVYGPFTSMIDRIVSFHSYVEGPEGLGEPNPMFEVLPICMSLPFLAV